MKEGMVKNFGKKSFTAVSIALTLFGLPGVIASWHPWFQWWQAVSPAVPSLIVASGISILIMLAVGPLWHWFLPLFRPGLRLKKLSRLLEEGVHLDDATRDTGDIEEDLDFIAHTKLIKLEIHRLFNIDIDPYVEYWSVVIRKLAPLAKYGEYKEIRRLCHELPSIQWNEEQPPPSSIEVY